MSTNTDRPSRLEAWRALARDVTDRAERIRRARWNRAMALAREAGVSEPIHIHNALAALHSGQPWRNVDYKKLKRAHHIMRTEWAGYEIARRIERRALVRFGLAIA